MPKSVDVEDFAAKLALLTKRLNWSRAKLAQEVGVDKSLAARWLNGNSRPTGNSLMQLTTAAAQLVEGFTAADWDLTSEQLARRLGLNSVPGAPQVARSPAGRLALSGLRNPPASSWGLPYVGLWAGFYQSLTNRGMVRLCACRIAADDGLRLEFTDGFFYSEGPVLAAHAHLQAVAELVPLDNHLAFFSLNGAKDLQRAMVIDGLVNTVGPDDAPAAAPLLLFRIDQDSGDLPGFKEIGRAVAQVNERGEREAAGVADAFGFLRDLAPVEILRMMCPLVGTARENGEIDYTLRVPRGRSLAMGMLAFNSLPADAPLRGVPANLRRALCLDAPEKVSLVHSSKR